MCPGATLVGCLFHYIQARLHKSRCFVKYYQFYITVIKNFTDVRCRMEHSQVCGTGLIWKHFAGCVEEGTQVRVAWRVPSQPSGYPCGAASDLPRDLRSAPRQKCGKSYWVLFWGRLVLRMRPPLATGII